MPGSAPRSQPLFLSTPSARRATEYSDWFTDNQINFYPRPPRGGRLMYLGFTVQAADISIHALREEGDLSGIGNLFSSADFYPRPPRGGRPSFLVSAAVCFGISIHALREEGDSHAGSSPAGLPNFYPRPPRGGRHVTTLNYPRIIEFLSTPSARRATSARGSRFVWSARFLSTPSARRATTIQHFDMLSNADFYPRPPRGGRR